MKINDLNKHLFIYALMFMSETDLFCQVSSGNVLFSIISDNPNENSHLTKLIDVQENIINIWQHPRGVMSMSYLLTDSTLLYPYTIPNPSMCNGGVAGGISRYNWEGDLMWEYVFSDNNYQHHHDIEPLPNGNILILAWERHSAIQEDDSEHYGGNGKGWYEMGREEVQNPLNEMWSEAIFEIEMINENEINIVWEWHLWDHLIQDRDSELPNYGNVSAHPELLDINYGQVGQFNGTCGPNADWIHFNCISYNVELDQILLSSRHNNEIYIIDHSTTSLEAAGHQGGISGKGGDFLYRWGNPNVYDQYGNSQQLQGQHGANWISHSYPGGGGNIILFNNYPTDFTLFPMSDWRSSVLEIEVFVNELGQYDYSLEDLYGPVEPNWIYMIDLFSPIQSGAFRLSNGNTFVTVAHPVPNQNGKMFEVTGNGEITWEYYIEDGYSVQRAQKYSLDFLFPSFTLGDANFDQSINIQDILIIHDMITGYGYVLAPTADFNNNGTINFQDIETLIQSIMNIQ